MLRIRDNGANGVAMTSLIHEIQRDAADEAVSVGTLLRKAKMAAAKLKVASEFIDWLDHELDGYAGAATTPKYREIRGTPEFLHPYAGWRPITFGDAQSSDLFSIRRIGQSAPSLETVVHKNEAGHCVYSYDGQSKAALQRHDSVGIIQDVRLRVGTSSIAAILHSVRNAVLNWALELEAVGVLGEGMTFSQPEQEKAGTVSWQFFAQNMTLVGNVGSGASVSTTQTVTQSSLDLKQVAEFLQIVRSSLSSLPDGERDVVEELVASTEAELQQAEPKERKVRALLKALSPSLANISLGIAGSAAWDAIKAAVLG